MNLIGCVATLTVRSTTGNISAAKPLTTAGIAPVKITESSIYRAELGRSNSIAINKFSTG